VVAVKQQVPPVWRQKKNFIDNVEKKSHAQTIQTKIVSFPTKQKLIQSCILAAYKLIQK